MTPCTPVSWMQRSTSRRHWMFPLANTGMATAFLSGNRMGRCSKGCCFPPQPWGEGQAPKLHLPTVLLTPRPSTPPGAQRAEGLALGLGCLPALGSPRVHSPHSLDVLPGRGARQGPLLLLGAPVDSQQLGHSSAWLSPTLNCGPQTNSRGPSAFGFWGISFPCRAEERPPCASLTHCCT